MSQRLHQYRSAHWIVVAGTARITRGDESFLLAENQSAVIADGVEHRVENAGEGTLRIIEVRLGAD